MGKSFKNQIRYDMRVGILLEWKFYLCFFLVFLILGGSLFLTGKAEQIPCFNFMDYLVKIFEGIVEFQKMDRLSSFYIPKEWLLVQFPFLVYIAKYPKRDWEQRGVQMILRSQSKVCWWLSKCIWLLTSAVLYYAVFYLAIAIVSVLGGGSLSLRIRDVWEYGIEELFLAEGLRILLLMPCLCSVAVGMLQMFVSFLISPIIALCISLAYFILSVAVEKSWILGNYTMLIRNRQIDTINGVKSETGILIAMIMIVFGIVSGMEYLKRKELI
ncbi:MAG: hypothetical protein ACI4C5_07410 [Lachnospiraceae bacterium]